MYRSFKTFITEVVNDTNRLKHLSHLEDLIFEEGAAGLKDAIDSLKIYLDVLHQRKSSAKISLKWDGSPSVIIHQKDGDYWVASKSAFNVNPKLNRTEEDIKNNHGHAPGLVEKLTYALKYCKDLNINGTVQGDFLYTEDDLKPQTIDGVKYITFNPNTITYAVPFDSDLGKRIVVSKMGIIFHTSYKGTEPANMKATIGTYSVSKLRKSKDVFYDDALIKNVTDGISLSAEEQSRFNKILSRLNKLKTIIPAKFLNELAMNPKLAPLMSNYNNTNVRAGQYTDKSVVSGFVPFIESKFKKEIDKLKTEKSKTIKATERDDLIAFVEANKDKLTFAYEAYALLVEAKLIIVKKLNTLNTMATFVKKDNALIPTTPEGFVAVQDSRVVKLVDRLEFSRNNFLYRS